MKQRLTALALVLCMVVALVPAIALTSAAANGVALPDEAAAYDGNPSTSLSGTGTEADPFIIANTADFVYFYESLAATATAGQVFKMTGDVYWNAQNSGKYAVSSKNFAGVLDGGDHTVYNAYYSGYSGNLLFGTVTGTIKNLVFDGIRIGAANSGAGGICSTVSGGLIENVHLKNASISGLNVGGIAYRIAGGATIKDCSVEGSLYFEGTRANSTVGGILNGIAAGESGTVENCVNRATLSGSNTVNFGGIVACAATDNNPIDTLLIKNCENFGEIRATQANARVGGILGYDYRINNLTIEGCTNHAALYGTGVTGGILAAANRNKESAGVVIRDCNSSGTVTSTGTAVGGIIGLFDDVKAGVTITNSAVYGDVSGVDCIGGIIGQNKSSQYQNQNIDVVNSAVYGNVTATGSYAGILAGYYTGSNAPSFISATNCVLTGTVTAAENAGGIVGYAGYANTKVTTCNVKLIGSYVDVTVKVPAGATYAATIAGSAQSGLTGVNLTTTDSGISVTVYVGETAVDAPVAYYTYPADGELTAQAAELPALEAGALTNKTAVAKLNAYATANSLTEWAQGANAPELTLFFDAPAVPEIGIDGASLTIGRNVTLNLFVKAATVAEAGVTVKTISIVNNDGETVANGVLNEGTYVFTIEGLKAAEFGTNKVYKVQYTTEDAPETSVTCTETIEYSPLQYAINMYGKTDKAGLDEMLISLVNYADAAAKNTNASTAFKEKHADVDMTRVTAMETIVAKDTGKYTYDAKTMPGISATLTNAIELKVVPNEIYTDVTVKVGEEIIEKNGNGAYAFYATDLYNEITFTFTGAEGTEPLTATTSLVQYLNSYAGTDYEALATATAQYLYAACNFCLNNQPNA